MITRRVKSHFSRVSLYLKLIYAEPLSQATHVKRFFFAEPLDYKCSVYWFNLFLCSSTWALTSSQGMLVFEKRKDSGDNVTLASDAG